MTPVQLIRKIRLNQHPAVPMPETGLAHMARLVATDLVNLQTERLAKEDQRGFNIAVGK